MRVKILTVVSYILTFTFKMTSLFVFASFVSSDVTIAEVALAYYII